VKIIQIYFQKIFPIIEQCGHRLHVISVKVKALKENLAVVKKILRFNKELKDFLRLSDEAHKEVMSWLCET
jgi:hypothetical protein